jgi:DNA-binding transcriptional ArsR family regulator
MPPRPPLLKTIGNESRLRILLALAKHMSESLTVYKIAKFSGLERKVIRVHLRKLLEAELVRAKSYGPILLYSLNSESTPVQRLMELFNDARLFAEAPTPLLYCNYPRQNRMQSVSSLTKSTGSPETRLCASDWTTERPQAVSS